MPSTSNSATARFDDLGVPAPLVQRLDAAGITSPFAIQTVTIPDAMAGRDICAEAPTGSGKTLAFGLPLVARLAASDARNNGSSKKAPTPRRPRALVLVPTRELASQVRDAIAGLTNQRDVIAIYGGTSYGPTRKALNGGVTTVVACPGRLEDLVAQGTLSLDRVEFVVLDEADRMVDMGFLPAVKRILDDTAPNRQILLFSATIGKEVEKVIRQYLHDPARHSVGEEKSGWGSVSHLFWQSTNLQRVQLTADLVNHHGQAIVFCRTKRGVDRVARQLIAVGVPSVALHGDRTQSQRERALATFANGGARALVATDVAARGIHIDDLPCVVHFDLPGEADDYVHRSGRTGRAGQGGTVVTLVTDEHRGAARTMQRALGLQQKIDLPSELAPITIPRKPKPVATPTPTRDAGPSRGPARSTTKPSRTAGPRTAPSGRQSGTVKFFNDSKGFGFIGRDDGQDVFVHHTNVAGNTLAIGQRVQFEVGPGRRGLEARSVTTGVPGARSSGGARPRSSARRS